MPTSKQLSTHLNNVYFGGNWTAVNFKDTLSDINLSTANHKIEGFNTILALTFHIHYFIKGVTNVFKGGALEIRDKYSFNHPELNSEEEWKIFKNQLWEEAKELIRLVSDFPNNKLDDSFTDDKYGTYRRNIIGLIEHTHYHLGQIVILKKMIQKI